MSARSSLLIVGGGAAGIFAALGAWKHAGTQLRIVLLERNPRLGIKILISGGGKCNITHSGPVDQLLREGFLRKNEQRFLRHAVHFFTNEDVLRILERQGVPWHARENGRIFPDAGQAEDVLEAFERELLQNEIEIQTRTRVLSISNEKARWQVVTEHGILEGDAVILATGGVSYSKVGTTGDGIRFAQLMQHTTVPLRSALAPIELDPLPAQELQGVAIRNVELGLLQNGAIVTRRSGDLLFTHRGISGPAVLDISRDARERMETGAVQIECNLLMATEEGLRTRLVLLQQERTQQQVRTWLEEVLPHRFAPYVLVHAGLPTDRRWHALTKQERAELNRTLIHYPLGRAREIPIERGEVTAGGISLDEVDSKTMMSKRLPGLFLCGEMLDVAGEIGGYNLQAAYSTGWLAGISAAQFIGER